MLYSGHTRYEKYETLVKIKPPPRVIKITARGIVFLGFTVSSANAVTDSNPRKQKHNNVKPGYCIRKGFFRIIEWLKR